MFQSIAAPSSTRQYQNESEAITTRDQRVNYVTKQTFSWGPFCREALLMQKRVFIRTHGYLTIYCGIELS